MTLGTAARRSMKNSSVSETLAGASSARKMAAPCPWASAPPFYRGGDERPVNERQSAELFEDGIPDRGAKEIEAELVAGENGTLPQFENKKHSNENDGRGEQKGEHAGDFIAFAQPREKRARACDGTRARNDGGWCGQVTGRCSGPFGPLLRLL